jgi:hypothetical protein
MNKSKETREQKQRRALSTLLPYLSAADLLGTGLDFQRANGGGNQYLPPPESKVIDALNAFQYRLHIDKMILRLLHVRGNIFRLFFTKIHFIMCFPCSGVLRNLSQRPKDICTLWMKSGLVCEILMTSHFANVS